MKRQELTKYHQMTVIDLKKEIVKLDRKITTLKLKTAEGKQTNTSVIKHLRHDIRRLHTLITLKSINVIQPEAVLKIAKN